MTTGAMDPNIVDECRGYPVVQEERLHERGELPANQSIFYKLLTRIITDLINKFDFYQPVEQAGFRRGYSTVDHLQLMHMLIEKTTEYNIPLHLAFVDYQKAFDSVET